MTTTSPPTGLPLEGASDEAALPLAGLRVIEFTHMVMGPTCGMILADLGAEVIKIEPPGGDKTRNLPGLGIGFFRSFNRNKKSVVLDIHTPEGLASAVEPPGGDKTRNLPGLGIGFFRSFNRNKKSVVLDIHTPEGLASAVELIGQCDVMLENFRPGMMRKLGLDHESLAKKFPRLIYVSHKGFLPGPYENRLALDEVVQNMAGLTYMTGPKGRPLRAGSSVNDIMGGMFGAIGVLAALRERDRTGGTGKGQEIQSALFENCCLLAAQHMQQFQMTGEPAPPMPSRVSAWSVYDVFTCANEEQLFIAATSDKQFQTLCKVIERPDLAEDEALVTNAQRVALRPELLKWLGDTLKHHRIEELSPKLEAAGLPYAPIVRPDQLVDDPHLLQSGGLVDMPTDDGGSTKVVLLPLLMGGRRPGVRHALPKIGEHTDEVLAALVRR